MGRDGCDAKRPIIRFPLSCTVLAEDVERRVGIALANPVIVVPCECLLRVRLGKRTVAFHREDHLRHRGRSRE